MGCFGICRKGSTPPLLPTLCLPPACFVHTEEQTCSLHRYSLTKCCNADLTGQALIFLLCCPFFLVSLFRETHSVHLRAAKVFTENLEISETA